MDIGKHIYKELQYDTFTFVSTLHYYTKSVCQVKRWISNAFLAVWPDVFFSSFWGQMNEIINQRYRNKVSSIFNTLQFIYKYKFPPFNKYKSAELH